MPGVHSDYGKRKEISHDNSEHWESLFIVMYNVIPDGCGIMKTRAMGKRRIDTEIDLLKRKTKKNGENVKGNTIHG